MEDGTLRRKALAEEEAKFDYEKQSSGSKVRLGICLAFHDHFDSKGLSMKMRDKLPGWRKHARLLQYLLNVSVFDPL